MNRKVLIVDDDENIAILTMSLSNAFKKFKKELDIPYNLIFKSVQTINEAISMLKEEKQYFDVLLIDYDFNNDPYNRKGVDLVKTIRNSISKRCKIVFYTMHGFHELNSDEYVDLVNNDIYKFISKSGKPRDLKNQNVSNLSSSDQLIIETLIEALEDINPVAKSLEDILNTFPYSTERLKININDKQYSIEEVLDSIRLEEEPGNTLVQNLLSLSIMDFLEME